MTRMSFNVFIIDEAAGDLEDIYDYISAHDSPEKANLVKDRIDQTILSLASQPHRGHYPKELLHIGVREWREVFFKPYRIFYCVEGRSVFVTLIADGRRDMQTLLQRRLFGV